jgi:hypothetical protein
MLRVDGVNKLQQKEEKGFVPWAFIAQNSESSFWQF